MFNSMALIAHNADLRNVYLPLVFDGRRWGDLELAYSFG